MFANAQVAFVVVLIFFTTASAASLRLYFKKCESDGFHCSPLINKRQNITYTCPANTNDVTLYLWMYGMPLTTETLIIQNCNTLRLSFFCSRDPKALSTFLVQNITNMYVTQTTFTVNPPNIVFERIKRLEYIPENTFSQINRLTHYPECKRPPTDFVSLIFRHVNIGDIAPRAFKKLKELHTFSWTNVTVERVQNNGIDVNMRKNANFAIVDSRIAAMEPLAFRIDAEKAIFSGNEFFETTPHCINGTFNEFVFTKNRIDSLEAYGIAILARKVLITHNHFNFVKSKAFEKIGPGMLVYEGQSFASLEFTYDFSFNSVLFAEAISLHPHMEAYSRVRSILIVSRNGFHCDCERIEWLKSSLTRSYCKPAACDIFYDDLTSIENKNYCLVTSCDLPLRKAMQLMENSSCLENVTAEDLCTRKVTTLGPQTPKEMLNTAGRMTAGLLLSLIAFSVFY